MSHALASRRMSESKRASWPEQDEWVRPTEWLAFPTIPEGTQRVHMLVAVLDGQANPFAMQNRGAYRVDWGDGAGWVNYADNVIAEKVLAWADYASNPTTAEGWRQALITVEPNGGNLTTFSLNVRHSAWSVSYETGLLDILISGPNITTFAITGSNLTLSRWCQRVKFQGTTSITSFAVEAFSTMTGLVTVEGTRWALSLTSLGGVFRRCYSLRKIEMQFAASLTGTCQPFVECFSLREVPLFNLSACTNTSNMFYSCSSLREVPLFNLSACTNTGSMFNSCSSLREVPLFNLSASTYTGSMFYGCSSLREVPLFNLSACTNTSSMFHYCNTLRVCHLTNLGNVTTTTNMFNGTGNLEHVTLGGITRGFSVANNRLDAAALDALYTSLGTAAGAQTITVTGNPGTSGHNPALATAKGWTVTA